MMGFGYENYWNMKTGREIIDSGNQHLFCSSSLTSFLVRRIKHSPVGHPFVSPLKTLHSINHHCRSLPIGTLCLTLLLLPIVTLTSPLHLLLQCCHWHLLFLLLPLTLGGLILQWLLLLLVPATKAITTEVSTILVPFTSAVLITLIKWVPPEPSLRS